MHLSFSITLGNYIYKYRIYDFIIKTLSLCYIVVLRMCNPWDSPTILSIFLSSIIFSSYFYVDFQHRNRWSLDIYTNLLCGSEVFGECFITRYPFSRLANIFSIMSKSKSREIRLRKLIDRDSLDYFLIYWTAVWTVDRTTDNFRYRVEDLFYLDLLLSLNILWKQ